MACEDKIEGLKWARQSRRRLTDVVGRQATRLLSIKRNAEVQSGRVQVPAREGRAVRLGRLIIWKGCPCIAPPPDKGAALSWQESSRAAEQQQ